MRPALRAAALGAALLAALPAAAVADERLSFEPPPPGSYDLPPIQRVRDHLLLEPDGRPGPLLALEPGNVAIVSFLYRACPDPDGCPLALAVLKRLDAALAKEPGLSRRTRLVTVSFDPHHDTPQRMGELRDALRPGSDWRFFTAGTEAEIRPVLADFGQDAVPLAGEDRVASGRLRHVLKVFLVDASGDVRNVYSSGFLSARLLMNDVRTVLGVP